MLKCKVVSHCQRYISGMGVIHTWITYIYIYMLFSCIETYFHHFYSFGNKVDLICFKLLVDWFISLLVTPGFIQSQHQYDIQYLSRTWANNNWTKKLFAHCYLYCMSSMTLVLGKTDQKAYEFYLETLYRWFCEAGINFYRTLKVKINCFKYNS